jgi:hypothetical protein
MTMRISTSDLAEAARRSYRLIHIEGLLNGEYGADLGARLIFDQSSLSMPLADDSTRVLLEQEKSRILAWMEAHGIERDAATFACKLGAVMKGGQIFLGHKPGRTVDDSRVEGDALRRNRQ